MVTGVTVSVTVNVNGDLGLCDCRLLRPGHSLCVSAMSVTGASQCDSECQW